ncbi:hypothetical protein FS749_016206 [Ceratobasidium sp. UAMH 11750]|nr:hypothetical protein FS749_016206 [Ceratobasidium sp. UAMH 11750]
MARGEWTAKVAGSVISNLEGGSQPRSKSLHGSHKPLFATSLLENTGLHRDPRGWTQEAVSRNDQTGASSQEHALARGGACSHCEPDPSEIPCFARRPAADGLTVPCGADAPNTALYAVPAVISVTGVVTPAPSAGANARLGNGGGGG